MNLNPYRTQARRLAIAGLDAVTAATGLQRLVGSRYGGDGCILMWHSIVAEPGSSLMQDIRCSVSHLHNTIRWAHRSGIDIVDLDEALGRLRDRRPDPFLVLTFDDGYRDNLTRALPLCERLGAPMTVYTTPGLIRREAFYWWGGLVELLKTNDSVVLAAADLRFRSRTYAEKVRALGAISQWVQDDVEARADELLPVFRRYHVDWQRLLDQEILNIDEVRELADHPLVTVGAHTSSHKILMPMPIDEARVEIEGSKQWLESMVDTEIRHFAYPHGDERACGDREARLARESGYRSAVSTRRGNLFPIHAEAPFMLPRGAVNPNRESISSISAQVAGLPRCVASRFGSPIDPETVVVHR